jgi:hypothetical protein
MLAMCSGLNESTFVSHRINNYANSDALADIATVENARRRIWKDLHPFRVTPCLYLAPKFLAFVTYYYFLIGVVNNGCHSYMSGLPQMHLRQLASCPITSCDAFKSHRLHHSFIQVQILFLSLIIRNIYCNLTSQIILDGWFTRVNIVLPLVSLLQYFFI